MKNANLDKEGKNLDIFENHNSKHPKETEEGLKRIYERFKKTELKAKEADLKSAEEDLEKDKKNHNFVQFKRPAMKYFRNLIKNNPLSAQIFSFLTEYMDYRNAVVCSSKVLEEYFEVSRTSIYRALKQLETSNFLLIGKSGNTNVFTINPEIVWSSYANAKRFCEFQGTIFMTETENKDLEVKARRFKEIIEKEKKVASQ
jgi:Fe2+ or Zn2+ uptake regulation protein